jgi:type IV secretory pathway VirB9-like protein
MRLGWIVISLGLAGCASTPAAVQAPPVAEDLVGWSAPTAATDEGEGETRPVGLVEPEKARSPREKVYAFEPGESYRVDVAVGYPMDIVLQPGEEIHNIAEGDRGRADGQENGRPWEVRQGYSGAGVTGRPHVLITVTQAGLQVGMTITTTRRTYYLDCRSVARSQARSVRWTYGDLPVLAAKPQPKLLPDPSTPQRYHVGYLIEPSDPRPPWTVRQVVDSGRQTFFIFPPTVTTIDAPLVRLIGPSGPELVNSRMVGSVLVIDRIIHQAELRLGTGKSAELVKVTRQTPRTVTCPGDAECPVWPHDPLARSGGVQ